MTVQEEVMDFVASYTGVNPSRIGLDTLINDDLGVDGDDGRELLREFSERFGVDISSINQTYFGPEGFSLSIFFWPFLWLFHAIGWKQKVFEDVAPLPVSTLVESAKTGHWIAG